MTENRYENVSNVLMENIRVVLMENSKYGWDFIGFISNPAETESTPFYPKGQHDTQSAALNAGIGYIRATKPSLVATATKLAIEGEKYRESNKE